MANKRLNYTGDDVCIQVMLYNGQLDVIVAVPLTEAMLLTVPWKYQSEYLRRSRQVWRVRPSDVEVAGYVRRVHDFYQVSCLQFLPVVLMF